MISRKESTGCTDATSPLEDAEAGLDDFPGWIRTARVMPVNPAVTVVAA